MNSVYNLLFYCEKINIFTKYLNECCNSEILEIEEAIKNLEYEIKKLKTNKN